MSRARMHSNIRDIQDAFVMALKKREEKAIWSINDLLGEINRGLKKKKISLTSNQVGAFLGRFMKSHKKFTCRGGGGGTKYIFVKLK